MKVCDHCAKEIATPDFCNQNCKRRYYRNVPREVQKDNNSVPREVQDVPSKVQDGDSENDNGDPPPLNKGEKYCVECSTSFLPVNSEKVCKPCS